MIRFKLGPDQFHTQHLPKNRTASFAYRTPNWYMELELDWDYLPSKQQSARVKKAMYQFGESKKDGNWGGWWRSAGPAKHRSDSPDASASVTPRFDKFLEYFVGLDTDDDCSVEFMVQGTTICDEESSKVCGSMLEFLQSIKGTG